MILSHYTRKSALEGILRSRAFWATNFLDLTDPSEYFYAWEHINKEAMRLTLEQLPDDRKNVNANLDALSRQATDQLRAFGKSADPYGQPFVFSFAVGDDEDDDARGILTLWKLYAGMDGYCLQYRKENVDRVLAAETNWWNYEAFKFVKVRYKVDRDNADFKQISWQISQYYLRDILRNTGDGRIKLDPERWMPDSSLFRKMLEFCASHKDPMYKDEREFRILACPAPRAESRAFVGLARRKKILTSPSGKRYIALGSEIQPWFAPLRIMAANKASIDFTSLRDDGVFVPRCQRIELPVIP